MTAVTQWVRIDSWHILRPTDGTMTRCGLSVRAHPEPGTRDHQAQGWTFELPLGEKSCESCLRLAQAGRGL